MAFARSDIPTVLKTPGTMVLSPVQGLLTGLGNRIEAITTFLTVAGQAYEENRLLRVEIELLKREVISLQEAGQENRQLRALLNYQQTNPGGEYLPATIIAHDPNPLVQSVLLDRGSTQGVQIGNIVVTENGLLGRIVEVTPQASKVLLTSDPSSAVNALLQRSRAQGVVTGRAAGLMALGFVESRADIQEGDVVLTSGLGGGFPKGIPIGLVSKIENNDQDLFLTVELEPMVEVSSLENVLISIDFTPLLLP